MLLHQKRLNVICIVWELLPLSAIRYLEIASETDSIDQVDHSSDDEEFHGFSADEEMEVSERQVRR